MLVWEDIRIKKEATGLTTPSPEHVTQISQGADEEDDNGDGEWVNHDVCGVFAVQRARCCRVVFAKVWI